MTNIRNLDSRYIATNDSFAFFLSTFRMGANFLFLINIFLYRLIICNFSLLSSQFLTSLSCTKNNKMIMEVPNALKHPTNYVLVLPNIFIRTKRSFVRTVTTLVIGVLIRFKIFRTYSRPNFQ
jgi:hypothetical protein